MMSFRRSMLAGLVAFAAVLLQSDFADAEVREAKTKAYWEKAPALEVCQGYHDFLKQNPGHHAPIHILKSVAEPELDAALDACRFKFDAEMKVGGTSVPMTNFAVTVPVAEARAKLEVTAVRLASEQRARGTVVPKRGEIKTRLARKLRLNPEDLEARTDLVEDLGLDQSAVFYALVSLYESFGLKPPKQELTVVREIVANLETEASPKTRFRGGFSERPEEPSSSYVKTVYFATNRNRTGRQEPEEAFGGERAPGGRMAYGVAKVTIPRSHKLGQLESPWLGIRKLRDRRKHIYVLSLDTLEETDFHSAIGASGGGKGEILVYVHGFNVSFDEAVRRAAQISFDFGFEGAAIAFTWPSDASLASYNADWADALWSVKHMESFLTSLRQRFPERKIHLVAHSMGSKVLLHAMRLLAYGKTKDPMFASVMLCAPDFDAALFADQLVREITPLAKQWVVYTSKKDFALMASARINAASRLGMPITVAEGIEIIDASEIQVTPWSVPETHSYYATKRAVLDDMIGVLAGLLPAQRGLKARSVKAQTVWQILPQRSQ